MDRKSRRVNRLQNLAIVLLSLSALFLASSLPLFGALSERSLLELAQERLSRPARAEKTAAVGFSTLASPVRMVFTNEYTRFGEDALTTLSDEFESVGAYLGEAVGSAFGMAAVSRYAFLNALRGAGVYFDFTVPLPLQVLARALGVDAPADAPYAARRLLLCPTDGQDAALYLHDGGTGYYRFLTAVSSTALAELLSALDGNGADFAFSLGAPYDALSPFTLVLSETPLHVTMEASNALTDSGEETLLRRAEFNAHTENRFTESSGTVLVREGTSTLYLRPDGTVDYQGGEASPDSIYFVPAAGPAGPSLTEAVSAAQNLIAALLQDLPGDASPYLSGASADGAAYTMVFDFMAGGTPIRFSDGSHAASVTVEGQSITGFTLKARQYRCTDDAALLLPLRQAAGIAGGYGGAELIVAYVDNGGDAVQPMWIAD